MEFTKNDWVRRDIINKTKILTKWGSDMIDDVIPKKYQKYPSNPILKHENVLVNLLNMASYDACSIPVHVRKITLADISHEQNE